MTKTTMRKMLLAGVAALSIATTAHATDATLPPSMLGVWCNDLDYHDRDASRFYRGKCVGDALIVVSQDNYKSATEICRRASISRRDDKYVLRVRCYDIDAVESNDVTATMWVAGSKLYIAASPGSPVHTVELPKADPVIGEWCPAKSGAWTAADTYVRTNATCSDTSIKVRRNEYEGLEWSCDFYEVKRLQTNDGYAVSAECGGEGMIWNEKAEFRIVGKSLNYRIVARTDSVGEGSSDGSTSCAVVTSDNIPDEGQGRFLNLRAGPGTEFPVKTKLIPGDRLGVDATKDGWKHVTTSARVKADGWVRDKFLVVFPCSGAPDAEPAAQESPVPTPTPPPGDRIYQAYAQYDYLTRYCAASFNDDDLARAHAAVKAVERVTMKTGASLSDAWVAAKRYNDGVPGNRCKENFQSLMENGAKP